MKRPFKAVAAHDNAVLRAFGAAVQAAQAPAPANPPRQTKTLKAVPNFVTATDAMMRAPKPEDWTIHRGNYQAWGYSQLQQINKNNVKSLQLAWSRVMEQGINQATPLVYNGIMYLGNPNDVIQAIDASNGDLLWEYRHPNPPAEQFPATHGQRKRSIALYGDRVYTEPLNAYLPKSRWRERFWLGSCLLWCLSLPPIPRRPLRPEVKTKSLVGQARTPAA